MAGPEMMTMMNMMNLLSKAEFVLKGGDSQSQLLFSVAGCSPSRKHKLLNCASLNLQAGACAACSWATYGLYYCAVEFGLILGHGT